MLRKEKGITLISLVVTIIIIVILASIGISAVLGNNGIISNAKKAKKESEISSEKEKIQVALMNNDIVETEDLTKRKINLKNALNDTEANVYINGKGFIVEYPTTKRVYSVTEEGEITEEDENILIKDQTPGAFDGEGTESNPYIIMSIEDLVYLSQSVNTRTKNPETYDYIKLGKTLDFKSELSYCDYTDTQYNSYLGCDTTIGLMEALSEKGVGFYPISKNNAEKTSFKGEFDGQGYEIRNIYVNKDTHAGLFGDNYSTSNPCIKNLGITGTIISTSGQAGGIYGRVTKATIINCYNKCDVTGILSASYQGVGGIVGGTGTGGSGHLNIINCYNEGKITFSESKINNGICWGVGGIIGEFRSNETIKNLNLFNCYNIGELNSLSYVGGLLGRTWAEGIVDIKNCFNTGKIYGTNKYNIGNLGKASNATVAEENPKSMSDCYYLSQEGVTGDSTEATGMDEDKMKQLEFIEILNTNVKTLNQTGLAKWVIGKNGYPTLDYTKIWDSSIGENGNWK